MRNLTLNALVLVLLLSAACSSGGSAADAGKVIKSAQVGTLTVTLSNKDGVLRHGDEEFTLSFKDAAGKPVEVGAASLNFHMPAMGTMSAMTDAATLTTTNTPGVYRAKAKLEVAGEWQTQVTFDGPAGRGQTSFPVTAQ
jgi:nitrogen fixation protein FixH